MTPDPVFDTPDRYERPGQIIAVGISALLVIYAFALAISLVSVKGWSIAEVLLASLCVVPMWVAVYLLGYIRSSLDILSSLSARVERTAQLHQEKAPDETTITAGNGY